MSATWTDDGQWLTDQNGERRWYTRPRSFRCGGHGYIPCYCGGDNCVCGNDGEIECDGCVDCEPDDIDDEWHEEDEA